VFVLIDSYQTYLHYNASTLAYNAFLVT